MPAAPPVSVSGIAAMDCTDGGTSWNICETIWAFAVAESVTAKPVETGVVTMFTSRSTSPAAKVMVAGMIASADELLRVTTRPPVGAGSVRPTVTLRGTPPATNAGTITSFGAMFTVTIRVGDLFPARSIAVATTW